MQQESPRATSHPLRLGASSRIVAPTRVPIREAIDAAAGLGLADIIVPTVFEVSETLDPADVKDVVDQATDRGVGLTVGIPYLHPFRLDQDADLLKVGDGDPIVGLTRTLETTVGLGVRDVPFVLGYVEDRYSAVVPWDEQLSLVTGLFKRLAPIVRELGVRLCIKTHEEITTFEIARLIDAVGDDVLSVGFDPVNVFLRMEDPLRALRRLAPYVAHVYVDDATFVAQDKIYARRFCNLGDGVVDWQGIVDVLVLEGRDPSWWVDLHKGQYDIYPFDLDWLAGHPDLTTAEYALVVGAAREGAQRLSPAQAQQLEGAQTRLHDRLAPALQAAAGWSRGAARKLG